MERERSLDVAKGLAIAAVVTGHSLRGVVSAGRIDGQSVVALDAMLYSWHLGIFVFVTGLWVSSGVERFGPARYFRTQVQRFVYCYLLWSFLQGVVKLLTSGLVNRPSTMGDLVRVWVPEGQLWYLPLLVVLTASATVLRPWRSRPRALILCVAALAASIARWGRNGDIVFTQGYGLAAIFATGTLLRGSRYLDRSRHANPRSAGLIATTAAAVWLALELWLSPQPPTTHSYATTPLHVLEGMIATTCGVTAVLAISWLLAQWPAVAAVPIRLGAQTMPIFLAHIIFGSGTRIAAAKLGVHEGAVLVTVSAIAGIAGPLSLVRLADRLPQLKWLFEPVWLRQRPDLA